MPYHLGLKDILLRDVHGLARFAGGGRAPGD
jgi:hypothetical protein